MLHVLDAPRSLSWSAAFGGGAPVELAASTQVRSRNNHEYVLLVLDARLLYYTVGRPHLVLLSLYLCVRYSRYLKAYKHACLALLLLLTTPFLTRPFTLKGK